MMSQESVPATSGLNAAKNARVSACVLNIFQFPAITGLRKLFSWGAESHAQRFNFLNFIAESFDAEQFFAGQKFQRRAAARGNMRDLRCHARLLDSGYGISAPDDGGCPRGGSRSNRPRN